MKRVITYGTFDLFHVGHLNIIRRAKELGDYLIVAVSTDSFNEIKGKKCVIPDSERMAPGIPPSPWSYALQSDLRRPVSLFPNLPGRFSQN